MKSLNKSAKKVEYSCFQTNKIVEGADLSNSQPDKAYPYKTVSLQNCKPVDRTENVPKSYKSCLRAVFCNERVMFVALRCKPGIP